MSRALDRQPGAATKAAGITKLGMPVPRSSGCRYLEAAAVLPRSCRLPVPRSCRLPVPRSCAWLVSRSCGLPV